MAAAAASAALRYDERGTDLCVSEKSHDGDEIAWNADQGEEDTGADSKV